MKVHRARLSGVDFSGDTADAMYAAVGDCGFADVSAMAGVSSFEADLDVAGVSCSFRLHFDTLQGLRDYFATAHHNPNGNDGTAAYRRIAAAAGIPWAVEHEATTPAGPQAMEGEAP